MKHLLCKSVMSTLIMTLFFLTTNGQNCNLIDDKGVIIKKCVKRIPKGQTIYFEEGTYVTKMEVYRPDNYKQVAIIAIKNAPALKVRSNCLYLTNDTINGQLISMGTDIWKQYNRQITSIYAFVDLKVEYIMYHAMN